MKKIIIAILVVLLVINPVGVYASSSAAALEISGSLASGGLSGGADSKMLALAFTSMVIYGMGMSVKLNEQAKAAGETVQSYLDNMYAKWVGGTSAKELTEEQREELKKRFKVIATGGSDSNGNSNNKVGKNGKIFIGSAALYLIGKFINWLKNNHHIYRDADITPIPDYGVTNDTLCVSEFLDDIFTYRTHTICGIRTNNLDARYQVCIVKMYIPNRDAYVLGFYTKNDPDGVTSYQFNDRWNYNNSTSWTSFRSMSVYGSYRWNIYNEFATVSPIITNAIKEIPYTSTQSDDMYSAMDSLKAYLDSLGGKWEESGGEPEESDSHIEGTVDDSKLENADNGYTVIDPALYQQLLQNLEAGTQAQLNTADYVKAIMDQLNKLSNPEAAPVPESVPVVNPTDLSPNPQPLPDPAQDPVPTTFPAEEPAPGDNDPPAGSDPVTNPDPAPPDVAVPHMMIPLDEYFPFCIPFDVYHLLQKLSADPVAPSYTIGFTVYGTEVNYTISLDAFSGAMVIVRRMELLVCVVGLAIASRKIFTR